METSKSGKSNFKIQSQRKIVDNILESGEREQVHVTWLEGNAPEQHNDQPVDIAGTITAPARFLESREDEFHLKSAHAIVSKTDGEIKVVLNEHTKCEKYTIIGQVEVGKKFKELGINTYKNGLRPLELVQKLRLRRSIFKSNAEHANLLGVLSNVEAKVDKEVNESQDDRANINLKYKQTVTSNIPKSFTLVLPIIEGEDSVEIEVAVLLEVESGNIICYLESVDGADLIEEAFEKLVEAEVKKIEDKVTVIYR